ncbi:MAG: tetratricopeptide repeat protein [Rikenellaceae bacterium]|nr:tetratricopeptide repeat protein [Rikenellaceae bacterium]
MADNRKQVKEDPEEVIETAINKTELFIFKNGRTLLTILIVIVAIAGGITAYKYLYSVPQQKKAATAIFEVQNAFADEEFSIALNGDGNNSGFLQVAEKYGSTKSGNLAKHYAGQCYLRLGDYENAVKYFEKYKNVKGLSSEVVNAVNAGLAGDAYVQMGNPAKGLDCYKKAVELSANEITAPYYAKKAGLLLQNTGDYKKALEYYSDIKNKYPNSMEARDIDKFIGQVEQKL